MPVGSSPSLIPELIQSIHFLLANWFPRDATRPTAPAPPRCAHGGHPNSTAENAGRNCSRKIFGCDHGTHVAGIAVGNADHFHSVAPDAGLISIQIFSRFSGAACAGFFIPSPCVLSFGSDLIWGLEHVLELSQRFNIASVNLSLGGGAFSHHCDRSPIKLAIDSLRAAGIATVVSSGNAGLDGMISRPACISSAVAVGRHYKN